MKTHAHAILARPTLLMFTGATLLANLGCGAAAPCRKGPKDDVVMAARTAGEAVETGVKTGVEGVKAGGRAVGGFATDGSSGAKKEWKNGKADTKAEANEGAAETKDETEIPRCK
ncbi:MAG: hypothetical protein IPI67_38775 [Myxococcales bacterium]|nr:hypothetical protein [Myxococcales bacterium]